MIITRDAITSRIKRVNTDSRFYNYKFVKDKIYNIYVQTPMTMDMDLESLIAAEKLTYDEPFGDTVDYEKHDYLYLDLIKPKSNYPINTININLFHSLLQTEPCDLDRRYVYDKKGLFLLPKSDNSTLAYFIYKVENDLLKIAYGRKDQHRGVIQYDFNTHQIHQTDQTATQLFLNILLYAATKLDDFGKMSVSPEHKHTKRYSVKPEIITPYEIGKEYEIKKQYKNHIGEHASPMTHWRSGHWRKQPHGSRKEPQYKHLWMEPMLINVAKQ